MNKEKLIQLREKINNLFFKKTYPNGRSAERNTYLEGSL